MLKLKPDTTPSALLRQIRDAISGDIEDTTVTDAIAAYADQRAGKLVTRADLPKLQAMVGGDIRVILIKQHGTTKMEWRRPGDRDWSYGVTLARRETGVRWPSRAELTLQNASLYHAKSRNSAREAALASETTLATAARLMGALIAAREAYADFSSHDDQDAIRWPLDRVLKTHE